VKVGPAVALLALAACGSFTTHFRPGDAGMALTPKDRDPEVFTDRVPLRRYTAVGVIEVRAPSREPMAAFVPHAVARGRALGCDVLVARHLHVGSLLGPPALLAQTSSPRGARLTTSPEAQVLGAEPTMRNRREFVCGIYVAP
jgi:hypothetical protein